MSDRPVVFLGMPRHGGTLHDGAACGFYKMPTLGECDVINARYASSLLTKAFNSLWAMALASRDGGICTHFAMLHNDIDPEPAWLDKLLGELTRLDADVVSAVVPLKDTRGLTSTAIDNPADSWNPIKRLSLHEVHKLPETFDAADCGYPESALLINTGLWVCDLRKPWCSAAWPDGSLKMFFRQEDRIYRRPEHLDGPRYGVETKSEDWNFGRDLHSWGCKVYATRKVKLKHYGEYAFSNEGAWGTQHVDREFAERVEKATT